MTNRHVAPLSILEAIKDEDLIFPFLRDRNDSIGTWGNWLTALRVVYGLPVLRKKRELIKQCTGRNLAKLRPGGFSTSLFLTGRRCGKSRIAAVIGAYEGALAGHEVKLSPGERGIVVIVSPTRRQSQIVKDYIRAIFDVPILHNELTSETKDGFELKSGNRIEILGGDYRTVRGFTLLAAIVDEVAFFGYDADCKIKSDSELIRAIKPSLATTGGKLIAISSPYARRGWTFNTYQKNFGNDHGRILVWNSASRTMNPTLSQQVVDDAMAEDLAAAKAEFLGEFRDDVESFVSRSLVESLVVSGRRELMPQRNTRYTAFCDLSGGRNDSSALAIAYSEGEKVILAYLREWKAPNNPHLAVIQMAEDLRKYDVRRVVGDNYSAEWVSTSFQREGIQYVKAEKPKSQLYAELLPRLSSGQIELLDNPTLIDQLANLERRTRSGGRDIIDHPPGGKDDVANVLSGVATVAAKPRSRIGEAF